MNANGSDVDSALKAYKFERVKSLGFLCESFICLLLLWKPVVTLEEAAMKISKILLNDSKLKTKVRRLYDIANVLCVLKVIKKTLLHTGKPAFEWVGRSGIEDFCMSIEGEESGGSSPAQNQKPGMYTNQVPSFTGGMGYAHQTMTMEPTLHIQDIGNTINNGINHGVPTTVSNISLGLNPASLDLLEGILKVLRGRLQSQQPSPNLNYN